MYKRKQKTHKREKIHGTDQTRERWKGLFNDSVNERSNRLTTPSRTLQVFKGKRVGDEATSINTRVITTGLGDSSS